MTQRMKNILAAAGTTITMLGIVEILGLVGARHANAQEISTGYGLFCDTIEQVEYFIMLGDDENGLEETNEHFGTPKVCGLKVISFIEGDVKKVIKSPKGTAIHIIQIDVVGFYVGEQYKAITPSVQYSPFIDEKKNEGASLPITLV
jgi:hypothetical protein